jgi:DNA-binding response OmpR family regulator
MRRITFVTDGLSDESLINALREHRFDVRVETASSVANGRLAAADLLIFDIVDASLAIKLLREVRLSHHPASAPVMVIAEWGTGQATLALSSGADAFERKPIDAQRLLVAIKSLLRPHMAMTAKASALTGDEE